MGKITKDYLNCVPEVGKDNGEAKKAIVETVKISDPINLVTIEKIGNVVTEEIVTEVTEEIEIEKTLANLDKVLNFLTTNLVTRIILIRKFVVLSVGSS